MICDVYCAVPRTFQEHTGLAIIFESIWNHARKVLRICREHNKIHNNNEGLRSDTHTQTHSALFASRGTASDQMPRLYHVVSASVPFFALSLAPPRSVPTAFTFAAFVAVPLSPEPEGSLASLCGAARPGTVLTNQSC